MELEGFTHTKKKNPTCIKELKYFNKLRKKEHGFKGRGQGSGVGGVEIDFIKVACTHHVWDYHNTTYKIYLKN